VVNVTVAACEAQARTPHSKSFLLITGLIGADSRRIRRF
jgi:hypothetical protein